MRSERVKPLRWKQEPRESGLAGVCQGERGYDLCRGGEELAHVRPLYRGFSRDRVGYYWYGLVGRFRRNTASAHPYPDAESAKADAEKWVRLSEGALAEEALATAPGDAAAAGTTAGREEWGDDGRTV